MLAFPSTEFGVASTQSYYVYSRRGAASSLVAKTNYSVFNYFGVNERFTPSLAGGTGVWDSGPALGVGGWSVCYGGGREMLLPLDTGRHVMQFPTCLAPVYLVLSKAKGESDHQWESIWDGEERCFGRRVQVVLFEWDVKDWFGQRSSTRGTVAFIFELL